MVISNATQQVLSGYITNILYGASERTQHRTRGRHKMPPNVAFIIPGFYHKLFFLSPQERIYNSRRQSPPSSNLLFSAARWPESVPLNSPISFPGSGAMNIFTNNVYFVIMYNGEKRTASSTLIFTIFLLHILDLHFFPTFFFQSSYSVCDPT